MGGLLSASEVVDIVQVVRDAGTVGLLVLIIVSGAKGWWVFGHTYREMKEERDIWRAASVKSTKHSEQATTIAEILTRAVAEIEEAK